MNIAKRKVITFANYFKDFRRVETCYLSDGKVFMAFNGLSTRRTLIDLSAERASESSCKNSIKKSTIAASTMIKSITFQGSRRYVF